MIDSIVLLSSPPARSFQWHIHGSALVPKRSEKIVKGTASYQRYFQNDMFVSHIVAAMNFRYNINKTFQILCQRHAKVFAREHFFDLAEVPASSRAIVLWRKVT